MQARAHWEASQFKEGLAGYDQLVQRSPRLLHAVIQDLEVLVTHPDTPLDAHRVLGDAYTRADRLADALERYRHVLERMS